MRTDTKEKPPKMSNIRATAFAILPFYWGKNTQTEWPS